jgi:hypothetical protein
MKEEGRMRWKQCLVHLLLALLAPLLSFSLHNPIEPLLVALPPLPLDLVDFFQELRQLAGKLWDGNFVLQISFTGNLLLRFILPPNMDKYVTLA